MRRLSLKAKATPLVDGVQIDLALYNDGPHAATGVALQVAVRCEGLQVPAGTTVPTPTVPALELSAGKTLEIRIVVTNVTGSCDGYAQVTASDAADPDSTPNNYTNGFDGPAVEDDEAVFHVSPIPTCSTALSFAPRTGGGRGLLRHSSVHAAAC